MPEGVTIEQEGELWMLRDSYCRGGAPLAYSTDKEAVMRVARGYVAQVWQRIGAHEETLNQRARGAR
jgi:hypothetical protein